ncbi:MAG: segregation protein B [Candidatus Entotheonella factor]|uniref:Segregation protein B n=1 Tax=Entotheonella factor TaxID=1429438 RepID=W4LAX8_ENTF1|nr:MAG: segregation protein B [Candidatus Entotheonella factor]
MQHSQTPVVKDLVLVGGGHSHVTVLKRFGMKPMPGVRLTLICRDVHTPYSGMLPGLIAGHYGYDDAHIDLGPLSRFAGARFYHDEVIGLDLTNRRIRCRHRPDISYDLLSINIGSTPGLASVPGADKFVVPVKPINNFVQRWEQLAARVMETQAAMRIGVVGAGAGGVELTLAVQYRLQALLREAGRTGSELEFHLFSASDMILPTHNRLVQRKFMQVLNQRGVQMHANFRVAAVHEDGICSTDGQVFALGETLWVTDASAPAWLAESGLSVDEQGFIAVNDALQSVSHPDVFAAGDIAAVLNHPREKSGVFAVRQGRPLEANLRRVLLDQAPRPFHPQAKWLALISTGDQYAVASRGKFYLAGRAVWAWKDWIDRRFMRKYNELPEMAEEEAPEIAQGLAGEQVLKEISAMAMRCGGCGAKVGSTVLHRVLDRVQPHERDDVLVGLKHPDDSAVVHVPSEKVMVHTVDFFRAIVDDPYLFGKIAANHSLGDIFAMGAEAQTALAIATVPYGLESKVEDVLAQMLLGAEEVLHDAGAALVGGHSSEGVELSLGFAINGLADPQDYLRKGGMKPGDRLILTKPLGTGTLFAADMRLHAKGRWIVGALAAMLQSNREAAECLRRYHATACTDVTGFGLLGHLVEMTKASDVDAELYLSQIPFLDGAQETVQAGIFSSLQPQNIRLRRAVRDLDRVAAAPAYPLLFDPQTAGGLLASLPAEDVDDCLAELKALGYQEAAVIGTIQAPSTHVEPIAVIL